MENMMFDKKFVLSVLPKAEILCDVFSSDFGFSIDTRTLKRNDIFIALPGEHVDGHDFIVKALEGGASGLIIQETKKDMLQQCDAQILKNKLVIVVQDTYQALYKLAAGWRNLFKIPIIGITGSVGKTSTREIVVNILREKGLSYETTSGNFNTSIGLALSLLKLRPEHQVGVFEVGISKRGEMNHAVDVLKPTIAAITMVGHSHMEGLGSLIDIAHEKRDIFKHFNADSVGVINGDQPQLAQVGYTHPVLKFGSKSTNQIQARKIGIRNNHIDFVLKIYGKKYNVHVDGVHEGRVYNALAAASICYLLKIDNAAIISGINKPVTVPRRFEPLPLKRGNGFLIDDCYNASPESVKVALLALEAIKTEAYKVAVLGDMLELGVDSPFWHRQIGRFLRKALSIQEVILVGKHISQACPLVPSSIKVSVVNTPQEAIALIEKLNKKELLIVTKASRAVHLDVIADTLAQRPISFEAAKRISEKVFEDINQNNHIYAQ